MQGRHTNLQKAGQRPRRCRPRPRNHRPLPPQTVKGQRRVSRRYSSSISYLLHGPGWHESHGGSFFFYFFVSAQETTAQGARVLITLPSSAFLPGVNQPHVHHRSIEYSARQIQMAEEMMTVAQSQRGQDFVVSKCSYRFVHQSVHTHTCIPECLKAPPCDNGLCIGYTNRS